MSKIQLSNLVFLLSGMSLACDININDGSGDDDNGDGGTASNDDDDDDDDNDDDDDDDDNDDDDDDDDDDDMTTDAGDDDDDDDMTTGLDTGDTDGGSGGEIYVCEAYGLWAEACLMLDATTYAEYCFDLLEYAYDTVGLECAAAQEEAFACIALTPCEEVSEETCIDERNAAAEICGTEPQ